MSKLNTTMKERDMQKVASKQKVVKITSKTLTYAFLIIMALIVIFPFYFMLISSVKSLAEYQEESYSFHFQRHL